MIFYILLAIVLIAVIWSSIVGYRVDGFFGVMLNGLVSGIISIFLAAMIFFGGFAWWMFPSAIEVGRETTNLAALAPNEDINGRFYFLGGGYINETRVLHFIPNREGAYNLDTIDANNAVIYQDTEEPEVTLRKYEWRNSWLVPWVWSSSRTAEFHVPKGSIVENFTITNE